MQAVDRSVRKFGGWFMALVFLSLFSLFSSPSAAAENDLHAQLMNGYTTQQSDPAKAIMLFQGVAEQAGNIKEDGGMVQQARYALCEIYRDGEGINKDYAQAATWCRKVAEQKEAQAWDPVRRKKAQGILGVLYFDGGHGLAQDYAEAKKWLLSGAEESAEAKTALAQMYAKGLGVPQDKAEAYKWCVLSGGCGDKDKTCAESLGLTPPELERGKVLVDEAYGQEKICTHYDASLYPSCWGGTGCAAGSPYLFNLNGSALLALAVLFSAGMFWFLRLKEFSKGLVAVAVMTVLLTLYIAIGNGGIESFLHVHLGIAATATARPLVHLDFALMLAGLFGGAAGAVTFIFIKKYPGAALRSLVIFGISLLNVLIEFVVAAASA